MKTAKNPRNGNRTRAEASRINGRKGGRPKAKLTPMTPAEVALEFFHRQIDREQAARWRGEHLGL